MDERGQRVLKEMQAILEDRDEAYGRLLGLHAKIVELERLTSHDGTKNVQQRSAPL